MDLNNVISSIPSLIGSLYESILVINKDLGTYYEVQYTGEQLKVSAPRNYDELVEYTNSYKEDLLNRIEGKDFVKELFLTKDGKEKLITVVSKDDCKLVFIIDISLIDDDNSDKKLLIIADDSPVITKFFKKTFQEDYEVMVASNGKEAIDLIEQYKDTKLVGFFCDLMMPEMDGFEVLEYFKENNLFEKVPVSVISGEDTQDGIERATSYGVVDMLQKPFTAEAAKTIVERTISFSPNL